MRASKQQQQQHTKPKSAAPKEEEQDPFKQRSAASEQDENDAALGLTPLPKLISQAKTSGKLVISGRSLPVFPDGVCSTLLSPNSPFHPGNRPNNGAAAAAAAHSQKSVAVLDMNISASNEDDASDRWYDQKPLSSLKATANEIAELPEAVGGFDQLTVLDFGSNLLSNVPMSVMNLVSLTSLNLSNNKLDELPLQLLALESLISLDLSHNNIFSLWTQGVGWKPQLEELQKSCREAQRRELLAADSSIDSVTPESSMSTDFWDTFPSSPAPGKSSSSSSNSQAAALSDAPFPRLKILNLSHNRLSHDAVQPSSPDQCALLPPSLYSLDLSKNPLGSRRPLDLGAVPFAGLESLQTFSLASCELEKLSATCDGATFFPRLKELDLSKNSLDLLDDLPSKLAQSGQRPVQMTGLPRALESLNTTTTQGKEEPATVRLGGNHLAEEARRWRTHRRGGAPSRDGTATPTPSSSSTRVLRSHTKAAAQAKQADDELANQVARLQMHDDESTSPTPANSNARGKVEDFAYAAHYDAKTTTLRLSSQGMQEFPQPSTSSNSAPAVSLVEMSRNQLKSVPLTAFAEFGWCDCLERVELGRNRISSVAFPPQQQQFTKLETLNLASNMISDPTLLRSLAEHLPRLEHLDLTYNFISSLEGVDQLLLRPGGGLRTLRLGGNRLSDLAPLVEVATRCKDDSEGARAFQCRELELVSSL